MTKKESTPVKNKTTKKVTTTKKPIKEPKTNTNYVQLEGSCTLTSGITTSATAYYGINDGYYNPSTVTNIDFNNHTNLGDTNEGNCGYVDSKPTLVETKLDELIDLLKHLIVETTPVEAILTGTTTTTQTQTLQQLSFTDLYNIKEGLAHTIGVNNYASGDSWAQRTKHTATMRFTSIEKEIERRLSEINW